MAKSRTNRRPSTSPSFSSTLTTLFFIVIAVFSVWMLISKNADPPQTHTTTTRTAIDNSATNNFFSSSDDSAETTTTNPDQKDTPAYRDNPGYLPDDAIKSDEKNPNAHFNKDSQKEQSSASQAQLSEESTLTQRQEAPETNEAGADNYHQLADKMSESERVQRSSIGEASEGYQKDEEENARAQDANPHDVNVGENHEPNAGRQQDVSNFNDQESKTDDDELNKKQLREDKGEVSEEDQKQPDQEKKQDENSNSHSDSSAHRTSKTSKQGLEDESSQLTQTEFEEKEANKPEQQKQDESSNSYSDSDTLNTSEASQRKHEGESSKLNQKEFEVKEAQKAEQHKHDESSNSYSDSDTHSTSEASQLKHEDESSQLNQTEFEEKEAQKAEQQKQDESSNSYSDYDTHSTSEASQLEHVGESSQLNQKEFEEKEAQKAEQQKQDESSNSHPDSDTHSTSEASHLEHEGESSQLTQTESEENETRRSESVKKKMGSKKSWSTQADQSQQQQERQNDESDSTENTQDYTWHLCNVTAGADYIPCLDNVKALKQLRSTKHYEHRERHCPEDAPSCLVPLPKGYKRPIEWPASRDKIWYYNVPQTLLAEVKGHQNWVKRTGEFLTFPGGGTQFIHGALHYIDFIQLAEIAIAWGKRTRVILDVGCGVGSFGGYLFERDVIAMSFAPKDEHVAQVQFALERGIPAISAVMGSQRLPFPSMVFDLVHCARCRVPWHAEGGKLLLELNRVLRPGGYFVWSATPVYRKLEEDIQIWNEMSSLTKSMCWELVTINNDKLNNVGVAIYRKPLSNECYERREENSPPICNDDDDPNAAWYVPLQACVHKVPVEKDERGTKWPKGWPNRLYTTPYWLNDSQVGIYGKPASQDFAEDTKRWKNIVDEMSNNGITWSNVRNVMDMRAVYGGFAAALRDLPVWVFNVVNVDAPDTLPIIYERGLFGIYHDWCESFSTYPRTYDLLHADGLFSKLKKRCKLVPVIAEVDRIVRPGGKLIVRDDSDTLGEVENLLKSLHWETTFSKYQESSLCAEKGKWRPDSYVAVS